MAPRAQCSPTTDPSRERWTSRLDQVLGALEGTTCHSWKMALDRRDVISEVSGTAGAPGAQLFLRTAAGSAVTDLDGNTLIDLCMGYGTHLLGHGHPAVSEALQAQIIHGWQVGLPASVHLDCARLIQAAGPSNERVAFCTSGSDATLFAMRCARAVTGKDTIGVFTGSFHGAHDYGLVSSEPVEQEGLGLARKVHLGAGIPRAIDEVTSVLPYGHPAAFDMIRRQRQNLAAVIVEAVRPAAPHLDAGPWLQELAAVCRYAGVLFILDETTTGFRLAYGGAQEVFGLQPDLSTYGKAVGGGLPLGVVAGRADLMASFGGEPSARSIFTASTFSGHPLSVAASAAALGFAAAHRDTLYPALDRLAQHLADGVAGIADRLGITARMLRAGSIIRLAFGTPHKRGWAVPEDLRRLEDAVSVFALHGGLLMQSGLRGFVSGAHTESDINRVVEILDAAMIQAKSDGLFTALAQG